MPLASLSASSVVLVALALCVLAGAVFTLLRLKPRAPPAPADDGSAAKLRITSWSSTRSTAQTSFCGGGGSSSAESRMNGRSGRLRSLWKIQSSGWRPWSKELAVEDEQSPDHETAGDAWPVAAARGRPLPCRRHPRPATAETSGAIHARWIRCARSASGGRDGDGLVGWLRRSSVADPARPLSASGFVPQPLAIIPRQCRHCSSLRRKRHGHGGISLENARPTHGHGPQFRSKRRDKCEGHNAGSENYAPAGEAAAHAARNPALATGPRTAALAGKIAYPCWSRPVFRRQGISGDVWSQPDGPRLKLEILARFNPSHTLTSPPPICRHSPTKSTISGQTSF